MSKDKIADYDGTTAANNTDIGGISIAEGMLPSAVNNSMRELTKQLGAFANGTDAIDALTVTGDLTVDTSTLKVDSTNNRVGIGTSSPSTLLHLDASADGRVARFGSGTSDTGGMYVTHNSGSTRSFEVSADNILILDADRSNGRGSSRLQFNVDGSEAMRVDASGNVMVGTTDSTPYNDTSGGGFVVAQSGLTSISRETTAANQTVLHLNNTGVDGIIAEFAKDGTALGAISIYGADMFIGTEDAGLTFNNSADLIAPVNPTTGATRDNAIDLGASNARFKDLYLGGNLYIGGTGSANALSDYEEGAITGLAVNQGTISTEDGRYTKIGNRVFFSVLITQFSNTTSTATIAITGLPFTSSANNKAAATVMGRFYYGSDRSIVGYIQASTTQIYLYVMNGTGDWDSIQHSELQSSNANFFITGHYEAA